MFFLSQKVSVSPRLAFLLPPGSAYFNGHCRLTDVSQLFQFRILLLLGIKTWLNAVEMNFEKSHEYSWMVSPRVKKPRGISST
jgi:hypothetical protein